MIQIIAGKKGSGKTKRIIDMTNEKVKDSVSTTLYLLMTTTVTCWISTTSARFINASEYKILTPEMFLGFLCGMLSQNFDVGVIFIDAFKKLVKTDLNQARLVLQAAGRPCARSTTWTLSCPSARILPICPNS